MEDPGEGGNKKLTQTEALKILRGQRTGILEDMRAAGELDDELNEENEEEEGGSGLATELEEVDRLLSELKIKPKK